MVNTSLFRSMVVMTISRVCSINAPYWAWEIGEAWALPTKSPNGAQTCRRLAGLQLSNSIIIVIGRDLMDALWRGPALGSIRRSDKFLLCVYECLRREGA